MPGAWPVWTPRGTVDSIYRGEYYTLVHTTHERSGPYGFGDDFLCFSHDAPGGGPVGTPGARLAGFIKRTTIHCYKQNMKALGLVISEKKIFFKVFPMTSRGGARMDPGGTIGRIYKEDNYSLLQTKYESTGPCGFEEEFFFCFTHDPPPRGWGPYGPQGHGWQDL